MCLVDPNKLWPGFTLTQSGFSKSCWVHFPQLQNTNVYIGYVSLGHGSLTKHVSCGSKQILTWVYFDSAWFLKILLGLFPSASWHQYLYGIISRPWELTKYVDPNKFWPGFTFTQPGFLKFVGVRFAQPQDTNIYICIYIEHPTYIYIYIYI